ncbi:GDYXXLXY domain-containing protein [Tenacibaculum aiptasiae]|uniref:GDYXXLXY domain-containing protein n=1 Tax=Tenacibaculum aiptasiae TaxID=426481 RepID=UPI00232CD187|nr:GDYXXLXY domain-containing protein [Tenacibaculum aiptasiae]
MKKYKWILILLNFAILLVLFNRSIFQKEVLLENGQLVLFELAPVDPRSLMQGDYMRLNYAISNNIDTDSIAKRGFCVIKLTENGIAEKVRMQGGKEPINEGEFLIRYNLKKWGRVSIGAESYFFQEGDAEKYEKAKYGGIKVDTQGNSLLVGLYDENRQKIE